MVPVIKRHKAHTSVRSVIYKFIVIQFNTPSLRIISFIINFYYIEFAGLPYFLLLTKKVFISKISTEVISMPCFINHIPFLVNLVPNSFEVVSCYRQNTQLFQNLLNDLDVLLGSNKDFLLGHWLEAAKALGTTASVSPLLCRNVCIVW